MKCPRCGLGDHKLSLIGEADRSQTRKRTCSGCDFVFTTVERIVSQIEWPATPRRSSQERGVRFDVCIGDDEPGAGKP